jgi:hypothetical protein
MRFTFMDRGSSTLPLDVHLAVGDRRPAGSRAFSPSFAARSETCGHGRSPLNRRVIAATSAERIAVLRAATPHPFPCRDVPFAGRGRSGEDPVAQSG